LILPSLMNVKGVYVLVRIQSMAKTQNKRNICSVRKFQYINVNMNMLVILKIKTFVHTHHREYRWTAMTLL
jgi:hypothetical protein